LAIRMDLATFIPKSRPLIMGVLNITPDSFSDTGQYNNQKSALKRAKEMERQGADIIDIGGESTGAKSKRVTAREEQSRVIPVLKELRKRTNLPISIDTYKSQIAREALDSGADIINDVTAFRGDLKLAGVVAEYKCPVIMMYSKDPTPRTTIRRVEYKDVVVDIKKFFRKRIAFARNHNINPKNIVIDPGMGHFISAAPGYSYEVIARLHEIKKMGHTVLIGMSRKSFLGGAMKTRDLRAQPLSVVAYLTGADIIRTHDVAGTKKVFDSIA